MKALQRPPIKKKKKNSINNVVHDLKDVPSVYTDLALQAILWKTGIRRQVLLCIIFPPSLVLNLYIGLSIFNGSAVHVVRM